MGQDCCATANNIMILACSGGSNIGRLSDPAAVELTQEGFGKMHCLAGIGGQLKGFVQSAKNVPVIAATDRWAEDAVQAACNGQPAAAVINTALGKEGGCG